MSGSRHLAAQDSSAVARHMLAETSIGLSVRAFGLICLPGFRSTTILLLFLSFVTYYHTFAIFEFCYLKEPL